MNKKTRSDKKDTICKRCGQKCSTPQKLREHLKRKNPCRSQTNNQQAIQETIQTSIQTPPIQENNQQLIQEASQEPVQIPNKDTLFKNPAIEWNYKELKSQLFREHMERHVQDNVNLQGLLNASHGQINRIMNDMTNLRNDCLQGTRMIEQAWRNEIINLRDA
ncbi:11435_t:CDS:2, partial [Funneliformis geosporum]